MAEKRRYSIRRSSVALTAKQWVVVGTAVAIGVVGGSIIATTVDVALGGILFGIAALTMGIVVASGRYPDNRRP